MKRTLFFKSSLILLLIFSLSSCLESSFELASESRLPKWFKLPEGKSRTDFTVRLDYYSSFKGGNVVLKFCAKDSFFCVKKIKAERNGPSIELKKPPVGSAKGYPAYEIITVDGVTEVIEHRKMEPVFYLVDDPAILAELGVSR